MTSILRQRKNIKNLE